MPEAFDTGPLSWVKDEINQSLKKVLEHFKQVYANPEEFASLRFTIAHLYQVSGALDMVGLEGCKRYCAEIEKLTNQLEKQQLPTTQAIMADLIEAVEALSQYLQDLLNGQPDTPTKLYPNLKKLVEAQGEAVEESELFFPDTDFSAPKDLPQNPIEDSAIPIFVSEQRAVFQRALLDWLKFNSTDALTQMRTAVANVLQVQRKNASKALWWAATAFTDALSQAEIAGQAGAKKLCRKLDRQLHHMAMGESKIPSQLLRDLLYYVAVSDASTENIAQLKQTCQLDQALPRAGADGSELQGASASEKAAFAQLLADLPALKELWAKLDLQDMDLPSQLEAVLSKLESLVETIKQAVRNQSFSQLLAATHQAIASAYAGKSALDESLLIEVAAAFNLMEIADNQAALSSTETEQKCITQTERLQALIVGIPLKSALEAFATNKLETSVVDAVAKQIIAALAQVEKSLDLFFRNTANIAELDDVVKPIQQVAAAFDMLELSTPKSIAQYTLGFVDYFKTNVVDVADAKVSASFEVLAENLSLLGLYAQELPNVRPPSERALAEALERLKQQAQALQLQVSVATELSQIEADIGARAAPAETSSVDAQAIRPAQAATDQALDAELQDIFLTESEEVLASLAQNLQALRVNHTDSEALGEVRRAFHTLKGSGRTIGLTAMGEVAWSVESLLNLVIEHKGFPNPEILSFVEKTSADFATWVAELQEKNAVVLHPAVYQAEAQALAKAFEQALSAATPVVQKEEVLIGGTRKLSRAFFNIFIAEAQQHLHTLMQAQQALALDSNKAPTEESRRAAHTLGSNALTAGFKPVGDLARALEHWLDEHHGHWVAQHISLYGNVVNALDEGLARAKALKNPKSTRALIIALKESTAAMQQTAAKQAEAAVIEAQLAESSDKKVKTKTKKAKSKPEATAQSTPAAVEKAAATQRRDAVVNDELLALFIEEARELVPQIGKDLRGWRASPQELEHSDSLQRALHTLKGSARMAAQAVIGDSVHGMEDHVIRALRGEVSAQDFESMFAEFDRISYMLEDLTGGVQPTAASAVEPVAAKKAAVKPQSERKTQFLRMRADVLDRLINEAGEVSIMRSRMEREMQNFKQSSTDLTDSISRLRSYLRELEIEAETQLQSRMSLLQEANETFDPLEFDRFTRLQELTRMMAESVNDVATVQHGLLLNLDQTDAALQQQNRMNRELQQGLMGVRMLPFATITERLQRIVRQTARELNKRVEMTIEGETVEIDRGVLDKMGAPLEHLLRNAVAHGLESAEVRARLGKAEVGQIKLKVSLENDEITLVITDDGAGVNLAKVKQKAIEKGMFTAEQEITDQALMTVIFEPGFSTADEVSQIAGRGVGLDAVRSDIAALGGRIDVSNAKGLGAMFNVYLPVTLSVAQVVLMRAGNKVFAVPSVMVEQVQKLKQADLNDAYAANKVLWAGRDYPLHFLSKLIGDYEHVAQSHTYTPVLLLRSGSYRIALHVDDIIGNQEVVMKAMGTQLSHVPGMIGATVMGDGAIVLVINPVLLANRDALSSGAIKVTTVAPVVEQLRKVALVVDDSLTMRKVLSRVLEREDFEVVTANDGMDAIQKLQEVNPDIVLTDIEMPRMDGFEFARYVRDNQATAHLPLIMISSRTAEKHRNVAKEIGVDAFLGKPVQDEVLIEQVNTLLNK